MEQNKKNYKCKLCYESYPESDMSEEHYPAKSVGNNDIVAINIVKILDLFRSSELANEIQHRINNGETFEQIVGDVFDNQIAKDLFPHGRTNKSLCRNCNTFLGKYDEAYLKFFNVDGNPEKLKGFQKLTKYKIIKSIYAKFLSIPEAEDDDFDFIEFIRDESASEYIGKWHLYFVKRDFRSDLMGFADIQTGKMNFDEGVVYELSDDKFIYNLMNFEKHSCYHMNDIFEILKPNYKLVIGTSDNGGYHGQNLLSNLFRDL